MSKIRYLGLKTWIEKKLLQGYKSKPLYEEAVRKFRYANSLKQFRTYCSKVKSSIPSKKISSIKPLDDFGLPSSDKPSDDDDASVFISSLRKKKKVDIIDLCKQLDCKPRRIYEMMDYWKSKGTELYEDNGIVYLSTDLVLDVEPVDRIADTEITFGVASDLHFGSKHCQITALNEFAEICRGKGVKHIFSPGDILAGHNVYPGQQFELYALSSDEQEDSALINIPDGFEWYLLGGNHDHSFIRRGGGHNPVQAIASQRKNIHYVGFDEADIPILRGVELKMWHPSGGVPYSLSYRIQKGVEQIAYSELTSVVRGVKHKPTIRFLLSGHLHVQLQALFGSIFAAQCGCFEGQTNYLKKKGLTPNIGGYIIDATLGRRGLLKNFNAKFYVFEEIKGDYLSYKHTLPQQKIEQPLFG